MNTTSNEKKYNLIFFFVKLYNFLNFQISHYWESIGNSFLNYI